MAATSAESWVTPSALNPHQPNTKGQAGIQLFYLQVRQQSLSLIEPLSIEDCALQASAFVSPAKWHLAHTTWFFETFILIPNVSGYEPFNNHFQVLFNSYYNGVGEQFSRPKRHLLSRPSLPDVQLYREHVDQAMMHCLDQKFLKNHPKIAELTTLGLHHEMQHQELLLMDLKYSFFQNPLFPAYSNNRLPVCSPASPLSFDHVQGGIQHIGHEGEDFHFDNEQPKHKEFVGDFKFANRQICNGEYLEFITDGGYDNALLWLSDGWAWLKQNRQENPSVNKQTPAPLYWVMQQDQWFEFTLHGLKPLDLNAPVSHINFYEAHAYSQWAQKRLPTESEWEVVANQSAELITNDAYAQLFHGTNSAKLFNQNWIWTSSAYQPYPGYKAAEGAVGEYNGKFMCNQMVLRGGCVLTPNGHLRTTYRNFFYPQDRWPMNGLRLADD